MFVFVWHGGKNIVDTRIYRSYQYLSSRCTLYSTGKPSANRQSVPAYSGGNVAVIFIYEVLP